jgi:predicted metalloprotease
MGSRWIRPAAVVTAIGLAAACGGGGDAEPFARERTTFEREAGDETTTTVDQTEGIDLEGVPEDDQDDVIIEAAIEEVEAFWEANFSDVVGGRFQPVSGGFFPYGPDRTLPTCGARLTYGEIAQNAFYCPIDDLIAWDTDNLTNDLLETFGPFTLVIVMAHEYGHAVQSRGALAPTLPTIAGEQQADCFAGAFTAFVNDGGSDVLNVAVEDLDLAVAGFLSLRDQPGTSTLDPSAHGSGFDRIGAFQDGFLNGAERCAEYEDIFDAGNSTAVDIPLSFDPNTGEAQLNAPFDPEEEGNIFLLTLGSLETFWAEALEAAFEEEWTALFQDDRVVPFDSQESGALPDCPGEEIDADEAAGQAFACFGEDDDPDDDTILFDIREAAELYDTIGDFAVSGFLSRQYSYVAQQRIGTFNDEKDSFLQADCFSGAWTGAVTIATIQDGSQPLLSPDFDEGGQQQAVQLSAGDLDEAIQSFLLAGEGDAERKGTPFERVAAFRDGFFNGLDSCATYLEDGAPGAEDAIPSDDE